MKKYLPIIGLFAGVLVLFGALFWFVKGRQVSPETGTLTPTQVSVALEDRPYVTLTPRSDGHELKLEVRNIKNTESLEYELIYLAGDISRGVIGSVELKGENYFSRDLLLGSCSRNVCKYDEGVSRGTLTIRLRGQKTQKYETPFRLVTGREAKEGVNLNDSEFTFQGSLLSSSFYVIQGTAGVSKLPPGKIVGGPYALFSSGSSKAKGIVKIRLRESATSVKILGWNEQAQSWQEYTKGFETDGQVVSVEVDRLTTFVAVSP